jgi:hypothetical protein
MVHKDETLVLKKPLMKALRLGDNQGTLWIPYTVLIKVTRFAARGSWGESRRLGGWALAGHGAVPLWAGDLCMLSRHRAPKDAPGGRGLRGTTAGTAARAVRGAPKVTALLTTRGCGRGARAVPAMPGWRGPHSGAARLLRSRLDAQPRQAAGRGAGVRPQARAHRVLRGSPTARGRSPVRLRRHSMALKRGDGSIQVPALHAGR